MALAGGDGTSGLPPTPVDSAGDADGPGDSRAFRLYFYSFDCDEPMHVHAQRDRATCKFWLDPVTLASNQGLSPVT